MRWDLWAKLINAAGSLTAVAEFLLRCFCVVLVVFVLIACFRHKVPLTPDVDRPKPQPHIYGDKGQGK